MDRYVKYVKITERDYNKILGQLASYKNGKLGAAATDQDQPPLKKPSLPDWVQEAEQAESLVLTQLDADTSGQAK